MTNRGTFRQACCVALLALACSSVIHAQSTTFTPLGPPMPGLGEVIFDASANRVLVATGAQTIRAINLDGSVDSAFAGDGVLGNSVAELLLRDAEYLAVAAERLFIADQAANVVLAVNPQSGELDSAIGTDGIIGNDPGEPSFSGAAVHDIEIDGDTLFIATNRELVQYDLTDGSSSASPPFPVHTLSFGPLRSSGNCSADPFPNGQLLYGFTPNEHNGTQGAFACFKPNGEFELIASPLDISLTDFAFAPAAVASCDLPTWPNGDVVYFASRNATTELSCLGANGTTSAQDDQSVGPATGIVAIQNSLYLRTVGGPQTEGMILQSTGIELDLGLLFFDSFES